MNVTINLNDDDRSRLQAIFGASADIDRLLRIIAQAGAQEVLAQAAGRAVFSSIVDLRLHRIFQLLQAGITLQEAQTFVASVFKVPPGRARGMVEAAIARYDFELRSAVDHRVGEILDAANWRGERWEVELPAGFVRDRVLEEAGELKLADPQRAGRGLIWQFPDETYQAIRARFGCPARLTSKK